jgi:hypothetical protein
LARHSRGNFAEHDDDLEKRRKTKGKHLVPVLMNENLCVQVPKRTLVVLSAFASRKSPEVNTHSGLPSHWLGRAVALARLRRVKLVEAWF